MRALPWQNGPRERLATYGAEHLDDAALLALLLGSGSASDPVDVLAPKILHQIGGLRRLARSSHDELAGLGGIGPGKAGRLVAAFELGRRALEEPIVRGTAIHSSEALARLIRPQLGLSKEERLFAVTFDVKNRVISVHFVAKGGVESCAVSVGDALRPVIADGASAVIFVHNHPSGDVKPSHDDVIFTMRLREGARLLGVRMLDHIIVAERGHHSFADSETVDLP